MFSIKRSANLNPAAWKFEMFIASFLNIQIQISNPIQEGNSFKLKKC